MPDDCQRRQVIFMIRFPAAPAKPGAFLCFGAGKYEEYMLLFENQELCPNAPCKASVASDKGVGMEFTVVITLRNSEQQGRSANYVQPKDIRVPVVDDEEIAAEHTRIVLDESAMTGCEDHPDHCVDRQCVRQRRAAVPPGRDERASVQACGTGALVSNLGRADLRNGTNEMSAGSR